MLVNINPKQANILANWFIVFGILCFVILLPISLYLALVTSPIDYQQSNAVRIMYIHVPSAWLSLMIFSSMAIFSLINIIWRNPIYNLVAFAIAPIGACFTFITLVTGSIWGKPIWGTWWVWDARLTSMLILFFMYIGYISLANSKNDRDSGLNLAGIVAIIGFINIPIIKYSVEIWATLHQPSDIREIDPAMRMPLIMMFVSLCFFVVVIASIRVKTLLMEAKINRMKIHQE